MSKFIDAYVKLDIALEELQGDIHEALGKYCEYIKILKVDRYDFSLEIELDDEIPIAQFNLTDDIKKNLNDLGFVRIWIHQDGNEIFYYLDLFDNCL